MSRNETYHLNGQITANFTQIDDKLTVYVNDNEVFSHGLIQHGKPAVSFPLNNHLIQGKNTVRVTVYNGPGWGVLRGSITSENGFKHDWSYANANAPKNTIAFDETIEIIYGEAESHSIGDKVLLSFTEIDDHVTVKLNGGQKELDHGILRHNQEKVTFDLTSEVHWGATNHIQVIATNGPGGATLVGQLMIGQEIVASWEERPGHVGKGVFLNDIITLDL